MADVQPLRTLRYDPDGRGPARGRDRAALRRDRRRAASRAGGAEPVQRGGDRPAAESYEARGRDARRLARAGRAGAGGRAGDLGAAPGLHARPTASTRTRTGFFARVRVEDYGAGPHPAARAHPSRAQGGPAQAHARHARQPLPHLQPLPRPRAAPPRRRSRRRPSGEPFAEATDDEGTRNTLWRVADPEQIAALQARARRRRAADRRRPPPLRDRARVRRRGRRRGRPPLRADAPLLARRPRPARLPHPPAAHRPEGRQREAGGDPRRGPRATSTSRSSTTRASSSRPPTTTAWRSATWTASTSSPSA